jgi:hypothetical protein
MPEYDDSLPLVCALTPSREWVHSIPLGELAEHAAALGTTLIMVACAEHDAEPPPGEVSTP